MSPEEIKDWLQVIFIGYLLLLLVGSSGGLLWFIYKNHKKEKERRKLQRNPFGKEYD